MAVVLVALMGLLAVPPPALGQSFLQGLFGAFSGPPAPTAVRVLPPRTLSRGVLPPESPASPSQAGAPREGSSASKFGGGGYRTVCVRLCDGYYWPISHDVGSSRFSRDARACRASCGEEARLFTVSASSPDPDRMLDLNGRAYARLPNAFRHRKQQVVGCQCKPEPWTVAELARHRSYQIVETAEAGAARAAEARRVAEAAAREETIEPPAESRTSAAAPTLAQSKSNDHRIATALVEAPPKVSGWSQTVTLANESAARDDEAAAVPADGERTDSVRAGSLGRAAALTIADDAAPPARPNPRAGPADAQSRRRSKPPAIAAGASETPVVRRSTAPRPVRSASNAQQVTLGGWMPTAGKQAWPGDPPPRLR